MAVLCPALLLRAEPGVPTDMTNTPGPAVTGAPVAPAPAAPVAAPTPAAAPLATDTMAAAPTANPDTYTVVAGDSLWLIAHKFNVSIKSLKKVNHLTKNNLKPGQVLKIPPPRASKTAAPAAQDTKPNASVPPPAKLPSHHKAYARAQPVQDFDIPASTFASCPVPQPTPEDDATAPASSPSASETTPTSAPVAKLVSPEELTAEAAPAPEPAIKPVPVPAPEAAPAPSFVHDDSDTFTPPPAATFTAPSSKGSRSNVAISSDSSSLFGSSSSSTDWQARFLQASHELADRGLEYDEDWRPPGESHAWAMDCSNTARYLYKVAAGIDLPRTASDQYYYLHIQNKAWDVPETASGYADCNYLRENLKPGDLLFWENTYRPERQPPITHVMVFLGKNEKGEWIMAGSQTSRGGEHNRPNGGPDIYVFDPNKPCGGYSTWLGLVHHHGRFCAFGRPLEADRSKLSVATND